MVLNYNGVLYSYYVGGELRRPGRTYLYASVISIGVLVVVWGGVWALLRHTAGLHFMQAQANLGASSPAAYAKVTSLSAQAGGLAFCILTTYANLTDIVALESLFFALILLAGGVAATFLPLRRPDLVTRAGQSDVARRLGVPVITWVGGATTALALFTVIEIV